METIQFRVIKVSDNMCRIEANDCRSIYRNIAGGACICSLDVMLDEMKHIATAVETLGNKAVFVTD